jgi:DNA replication and repair protein RecF
MGLVEGQSIAEHAAQAGSGVAISRVMLNDFRSYAVLDLRVQGRIVVLTGPNGAGKTNLLEALSTLAPGRGLRGARLSDLSRSTPGDTGFRPWSVGATVTSGFGETQLGVGFMPGLDDAGQMKRVVRIDGVPASSPAALVERLRLVWLIPAMDRLFHDGAAERRRFLDRLITSADPQHARRWNNYETAMRERIGALRSAASEKWLVALERTMAENAIAAAASRREGTKRLTAAMSASRSSAFPMAQIALEGTVEGMLETMPAIEAEDQFAEMLARERVTDGEAGRTAVGPHLTDLIVHHREKGLEARTCSTGEQKALLIRLVLAGAAVPAAGAPEAPVLLLDEIAAHLDEVRRQALFDEIDTLGVQAWITGTDTSAFSALDGRAQFLRVGDGAVRA